MEKPFNYSGINNYAASKAKGDYLLFMNNDVRVSISSEWLTEMLGVCGRDDVGCVGARLYYPNNTIQHAGIVIGIGGVAGAMFVDLPRGRSGYMHKAAIMQDLSAVTAALMLVKRSAFEAAGGFTEELAVAFNDVDFCLKLIRDTGLRVERQKILQVLLTKTDWEQLSILQEGLCVHGRKNSAIRQSSLLRQDGKPKK